MHRIVYTLPPYTLAKQIKLINVSHGVKCPTAAGWLLRLPAGEAYIYPYTYTYIYADMRLLSTMRQQRQSYTTSTSTEAPTDAHLSHAHI